MPLRINGSTSGYVQLDAPAVAGTTNLTLPLTGFGKVLQAVFANTGATVTLTNNTLVSTGLTATITPSSALSRVLVLVSQNGLRKLTTDTYIGLQLWRNSTGIATIGNSIGYTASTATNTIGGVSICYLDSPSTTSAITYTTMANNAANSGTCYIQVDNVMSTMVLLEVGP